MVQIGETYKYCRFFGYEPASADGIHRGDRPKDAVKNFKADCAAIKAAGHRAQNMGYHSQKAAQLAAQKIEDATGIVMRVFNHDYL